MSLLHHFTRLPYFVGLWCRFPFGSVSNKVKYGVYPYPHYAYGTYWAAMLAARLGIPRITTIEFGVAGGRGLVALEDVSAEVGAALHIEIDVVGFDSGEGMPIPIDHRDLPHVWGEGFYKMDEAKLRSRLSRASLILGDVGATIPTWLSDNPAPIGFIAFDLDYYSSTKAAFSIFEGPTATRLPRIPCYFDDLGCTDIGMMNAFVGEYLAIEEFNSEHNNQKIGKIEQLRINRPRFEAWQDRMYAFHDFTHHLYTKRVSPSGDHNTQAPL